MKKFLRKLKNFAFKRKKRFYIILIVIFTLILLLDLGIGKFLPDTSGMSQMPGVSSDFTLPDDSTDSSTDSSSDDSSDSSTDDSSDSSTDSSGMPDQSEMPSGDFDGSMPGDSSTSDDSTASDDSAASDESTASDDSTTSDDSTSSDDSTDSDSSTEFSANGIPSGGSSDGEMPSGEFDGTMPGSGDSSDSSADSSDDSTDSSSDSESTGDTTSGFDTGSVSGILRVMAILQVIKSFWILIAVIAGILDAGSIFMLIMLRRKKKHEEEVAEQIRMAELIEADGEVHIARPQAKKKKMSTKSWIILIAALIALVVIVKILAGRMSSETSETEATTYEETAETGSISTTLPGTGTLTEEDAVEISLPSEVEITEWYVSDGDTVSEGDAIAAVDTDSALTAIATVQETIDSLDEELSSVEDEDTTGTVTAAAAGRVKAIYAETDSSVIDTMYESGSLMLLSLDGLMAVSFETDTDVSVGDEVTVTLSDGTEEEGEVESAIDGTVVVTLTDKGTTLGDSVTVTDADGTTLGTGELYIHSELAVMEFSGTVSSISVSVNEKVSSGDTLLSLEDIDNTLEIQLLVEQRSELEEQMETLFTLYQEGYLYASADGVISGIDSDDSDSDSTETDSTDSSDDSSTDSSGTDSSSTDSGSTDSSSTDSDDSTASAGSAGGSVVTAAGNTDRASVLTLTAESSSSYVSGTEAGSGTTAIALTSSDTDADSTDTDADSTDTDSDSTDTDSDNTDTDADSTDTDSDSTDTDSGSSNYLGVVTAVSGDTVTVSLVAIDGSVSSSSWTGSFSLSGTSFYTYTDGTLATGSGSDLAVGDTLVLVCSSGTSTDALSPICVICVATSSDSSDTGSDGDTEGQQDQSTDSQTWGTDGTQEGSDAQVQGTVDGSSALTGSEDASALADSLTGTTDTSSLTEAESSVAETLTETVSAAYSVAEMTWASITPQDSMYITITVDELDILSLSVGLEAEVTLDAFPGQSFTGEVESIDLSGTNEGGNSKYTAVVKISREEDMLAGMNASVKITLDTTSDVLVIPAEALVEDETGTYVYTSYDENSDTLGDPVEVETGLSDGTSVEITSGLSEGDTYYYSVLDTVNYSSATSTGGSASFGMGSMFGGGGGF